MIEEYVPSDTHRDDFYERFKERRVQQLNNPKETATDNSIFFPIVPLSSAPTVLPTKKFSNTSDDSGITSPPQPIINHSPRTPINNPSTSQIIPSPILPSQPLTPILRLILHNTRKYQNKEHKYNRSQPALLDSESVLRTRRRQGYKL